MYVTKTNVTAGGVMTIWGRNSMLLWHLKLSKTKLAANIGFARGMRLVGFDRIGNENFKEATFLKI